MTGPTGIKTLQKLTIDAINNLITESTTTQTQLKQLEIKLEGKLQEILKESRIQNKHTEFITDEEIKEDEVE